MMQSSAKMELNQTPSGVKPKKSVTTSEQAVTVYEIMSDNLAAPDGGWGWVVVFSAFTIFLISDGSIYSFGIFLKEISSSLGCSKQSVANVGAVKTAVFCFTGPFTAALVNRFGYRIVAITGSLLSMVSYLTTSFTKNFTLFLLSHGIIGGFGFGMIYISCVIVVGFYFEKWRSLATSIAVCGSGVGGFVMPLILTTLNNKFGWRHTFQALAGASLICLTLAITFKPLHNITLDQEEIEEIALHRQKTPHVSAVSHHPEKTTNFFDKYQNTQYPTIADIRTDSSVTVLHPHKVVKTTSSEFIGLVNPTKHPKHEVYLGEPHYDEHHRWHSPKRKCCYCCVGRMNDSPSYLQYDPHNKCYYDPHTYTRYNTVCCGLCHCKSKKTKVKSISITRPLYRDDIFFEGSVDVLTSHRRSMTSIEYDVSQHSSEYALTVTRIMSNDFIKDEASTCCPESVKRVLATMLDYRLLKSLPFLFLILNAIFLSLGYYTPYYFIKDRAVMNGMPEQFIMWIVSIIGAFNTLGRISCGVIATIPNVKPVPICYVLLVSGGIAVSVSGLSMQIWYQLVCSAVFGFSIACMAVLRTIILVEMLGLEKLTNATGMLLMFKGFGNLLGIFIAGWLLTLTGNYKATFYFSGFCIIFSGLILLVPVNAIAAKLDRRKRMRTRAKFGRVLHSKN